MGGWPQTTRAQQWLADSGVVLAIDQVKVQEVPYSRMAGEQRTLLAPMRARLLLHRRRWQASGGAGAQGDGAHTRRRTW